MQSGIRLLWLLVLLLPFSVGVNALEFRGSWKQGGLILGRVETGTRLIFEGRNVPVSPEGHFILALGRDSPAQVTLEVIRGAEVETRTFDVARRNYDIQRIEGVPQETVTPPPEVLERIQREAAMVYRARSGTTPRFDYLTGFTKPLEGPITGVYGSQRIYNGTPKNPHFGLDIAAPTGALVRAPASGIVRLAHRDMYFSGGTLIVDHGYGLYSSFIHLSDILVEEGQEVVRGEGIARVGATGRATGPHLDWRINVNDIRIDPAIVLDDFPLDEPASLSEGP
jgi:murein DD-endopeptidase MepM/ murein hydrolase activator NlpD